MKKAFLKTTTLLLWIVLACNSICIAQAPPDCPECIPAPGSDITDTAVPFDPKMLVILFVGAAFIIVKYYNARKMALNNKV